MRAFRRGFVAVGTALAILLLSIQSAPSARAEEALTISGTLTGKDGSPLGGLNVCAEPVGEDASLRRRECVTSDQVTGAFTISNLVPSTYVLVAGGGSSNYSYTYFGTNGSTTNIAEASVFELVQSLIDRNITLLAKPAQTLSPASTPKVTGKAKVGSKLTAKAGTWAGGATLSYQWLRGSEAIAGATKTTYKVQAADGGSKLSVRVTGTKAGFTATSQTSASTKMVPRSKLKAAKPKLKGAAAVGATLTANPGKWTAGAAFVFRWFRAGKPISGASARTYTLTASDSGKKVAVKVTGSKQGYKTVTKASKATKKVK